MGSGLIEECSGRDREGEREGGKEGDGINEVFLS